MAVEPGTRTVLLVDDDDAVRSALARHIARLGFGVSDVTSAEEALEAIAERGRPFDLVVSDVHLPGLSGIQLASHLQALDPAQPVVLITGDPDAELADDALNTSACSYLLKPFEPFELDAALSQALSRGELLASASRRDDKGVAINPHAAVAALVEASEKASGAGPGHGYRTGMIARQIARGLVPSATEEELEHLEQAARTHELGRILHPIGGARQQAETAAAFLNAADAPPEVVKLLLLKEAPRSAVRKPDARRSEFAVALHVADRVDHGLMSYLAQGNRPTEAMRKVEAELGSDPEAERALRATENLSLLVQMLTTPAASAAAAAPAAAEGAGKGE